MNTSTSRRHAFSLVEMLVALAIFLVLLAAAFVPIKLAGDLSGVATARAGAQQSAADGIVQIKRDIQRAIIILPNTQIPGVTSAKPYSDNKISPTDTNGLPYLRDSSGYTLPASATSSNPNACRAGNDPVDNTKPAVAAAANTSRLDLILPNEDEGSVDASKRAGNVLVSYYCRRRDMSKGFDPVENPVVLYRAQIPYRVSFLDTTTNLYKTVPFMVPGGGGALNADLSRDRFTKSCVARNLQWLTMNQYGEFDLAPLCSGYAPAATPAATPVSDAPATFGSHTLVLPSDTALLTPYAYSGSLVPDVTFSLSTNNQADGKIHQVTIQMSVGQYDANSVNKRDPNGTPAPGATPHALQPQVARTLTDIVAATNIK